MAVRGQLRGREFVAATLLVAAASLVLVLGVGLTPASAGGPDGGAVTETVEAASPGPVSPSGVAGWSLLAAAVVGTAWNLMVGDRRQARGRPAGRR